MGGGTRRIVFSRLWDSEKSQVSFGRLVNIALRHCTLNRPDLHSAIVTYTDVDGDTITISTPHELQEAFEQFMTHPSNTGVTPVVLRAQVAFVKGRANVAMQRRIGRKCMANVAMQKKTEDDSEDKSEMNRDPNKKRGVKWVQLQHVLDSLVTNMAETVEQLANDKENGKKMNFEMQGALDSLVMKMKATVETLLKDVEVMRPRKRFGVAIDEAVRKRRNLKKNGMLDSFVTDMTETIQKLHKSTEENSEDKPEMNPETNKRRGMKWVQLQHALDSLVTNMAETVDKLTKDNENGKKANLEMQAVLDSLVTNMKVTIKKLSEDVEVMRPKVVNAGGTEKPFNRRNGWKKRNLKMQDMLDSFVTDMAETVQKLSDLTEVKNGNDDDDDDNDDDASSSNKDELSRSDETKTTPNTDAYCCAVVGQSEPVTEDVAEVIVAKELGMAESTNSASKPSGSTSDVAMAGNVSWEVVP